MRLNRINYSRFFKLKLERKLLINLSVHINQNTLLASESRLFNMLLLYIFNQNRKSGREKQIGYIQVNYMYNLRSLSIYNNFTEDFP